MTTEQILVETKNRVGIIRLNRPEKLNAWTSKMNSEIHSQINEWNDDSSIGAIVIAAEGRSFCAGADIGDFADRAEADSSGENTISKPIAAYSTPGLLRQSKPTIAAVQGYAVGIGLTMILPCDIRIAAEDAKLSIRFIKMGLMPELGSTRILSELVGLGHATDMCLSGRMVPADEALRMGLVSDVVPNDELFEKAFERAEEIANNPTDAVMMIKELLAKNPMDSDLDAVMERESLRDQIARRLPNHSEAIEAFSQKRDPKFNQ
ncbi:MAG: enoyl-CoA hydratase/isomerase family protein [Dehalococcoidia bacterium]|nr:enoyl-CoA hydratase/isomerase family protein [Dehalococcoidia bacterium]|tara:strand:+ start:1166 stop:1957 length:792 start_codon:yes stop_codon:yes gene_type:complete